MKRIISLLLLVAMVFSFAACAGETVKDNNSKDTTAGNAGTTIAYEEDDLPADLNFDGQKITILITDDKGNDVNDNELLTDELTSDVINDSIYNRERYVEDRLGVEIVAAEVSTEEYTRELEKSFGADEDSYQLLAYKTVALSPYVFDNYLTDLYTVNYIDLEKPWWSQYFTEKAEVKDSLYMATGSLSLSLARFLFVVFYNKTLADNYSERYPELRELYSLVENGDWTYDKFLSLGGDIYENVNGDNERDTEDIYGIGYHGGIGIDAMWSSFDINVCSRTDDGWFELDVNEEKLYDSLERIRTLLYDTQGCFFPENQGDGGLDDLSDKFADGGALFMVNKMHAAESPTLRNMQDEYGIIPYPKYDGNQKEYYSFAHDQYLSFAIPRTNPDPDTAGAVLEAMASYSYRDTYPSYLNVALKGKYMNDPQSRKMVDMIVSSFKLDSAFIYASTFESIANVFRFLVGTNSGSHVQEYTKISRNIKSRLVILGNTFVTE